MPLADKETVFAATTLEQVASFLDAFDKGVKYVCAVLYSVLTSSLNEVVSASKTFQHLQ